MQSILINSKRFLNKNASTILTGIGGIGVLATTVMAVKATPKALSLIEHAKEEKGEKLTKLEAIKVAGPVYIPSVIVGAATISCIFGANVLNKRKQAALMSAYALIDNSYKEYKGKVEELYGEEANKEIHAQIAKDKYESKAENEEDDGKQLYFESYSSRYFRATKEDIMKAEYEINKRLVENDVVFLNEYYDLLGIPETDYGNYVGWCTPHMFDAYWSAWINFSHEKVEMDDGLECTIIQMTEPTADYEDYC